ncbi:MAG: hypothetical protein MJ252_29420 [archaeon]|nr:hypothetical protein [archaeon]
MASLNFQFKPETAGQNTKKTKYPVNLNMYPTTQPGLSIFKKGSKNTIATAYNEIGKKFNNKEISKNYTTNQKRSSIASSVKHSKNSINGNKSLSRILKFQIKKTNPSISLIKTLQLNKTTNKINKTTIPPQNKPSPIENKKSLNNRNEKVSKLRLPSKINRTITFPNTTRGEKSFTQSNNNTSSSFLTQKNKKQNNGKIAINTTMNVTSNNKNVERPSLKTKNNHDILKKTLKDKSTSNNITNPNTFLDINEKHQRKKTSNKTTIEFFTKKIFEDKHPTINKRHSNVVTTNNHRNSVTSGGNNKSINISQGVTKTTNNAILSHLGTTQNYSTIPTAASQNASNIIKLGQRNPKKASSLTKDLNLFSLIQENKTNFLKEKLKKKHTLAQMVENLSKKEDIYSINYIVNNKNQSGVKDDLFLEFDNFDDLNSVVKKLKFEKMDVKQESIFSDESRNEAYKKFSKKFEDTFNKFFSLNHQTKDNKTLSNNHKLTNTSRSTYDNSSKKNLGTVLV